MNSGHRANRAWQARFIVSLLLPYPRLPRSGFVQYLIHDPSYRELNGGSLHRPASQYCRSPASHVAVAKQVFTAIEVPVRAVTIPSLAWGVNMRRRDFVTPIGTAVARALIGSAITICVALSAQPTYAQEPSSQSTAPRDLQSIIDAKVLRVAVTHFDLPSFHVHGPDGKLIGPEIEMAQQIGSAWALKSNL